MSFDKFMIPCERTHYSNIQNLTAPNILCALPIYPFSLPPTPSKWINFFHWLQNFVFFKCHRVGITICSLLKWLPTLSNKHLLSSVIILFLLFIFKSLYNISKVTFHLQCFLSFLSFFFSQNIGSIPCVTLYILEPISRPVVCTSLSPPPLLPLPPHPHFRYSFSIFTTWCKEATHWKRPWC